MAVESHSEQNEAMPERLADVPVHMVNCYSRLWQFETWLRTMVYVEFRALLGDAWATGLNPTPSSFISDKALTHMPTAEMNALSYAQLSQLARLVDEHWTCFAGYFPPKDLWVAKLKEVSQIRHRVAHFRVGHEDDYARVRQFLRDVDKGFWTFCTSYNDIFPVVPQVDNPVAAHFLHLDPLPFGEIEPNRWMQIGHRDQSLPVGLSVRLLRRPWATETFEDGKPGYLYDFYMFAQDGRAFHLPELLAATRSHHASLVHLCIDQFEDSLRLTVPAILGAPAVIALIDYFYDRAMQNVSGSRSVVGPRAEALAAEWPEYVISQSNPLTFLDPNMPCTFFSA
jgi:hypothetical protein